ncbi:bifunctional diaminohydroxyphosphoribosylaminopyrimidine deaminase/5-amino-6-(5-phosphoribosylamino)uracil reductase RibD [Rhodoferax saidenbachensis]|uniref:Riboflavin biosynthesis protein RibD n=1 Tax=Rhodoferax saidenbachensis TaxID=1484693 RepID=A0ABU1ZTZ2_9BURK|nr:bifunctional diaminohydroxyphosphoribosylaminopyrimidine deaminase/5-amino-6-(5-phosphoribosylamino)uracil reductase RibD [Rhodoferax saidenbachensis]MDR7308426.1 diaminohydroxyphosphoribosylaminopyrimidine deaminase/5-amino-6-(5-phosphoribosylamino)uracil reductase [Rhodoferax saidenbachensis]
MNTFMNLAVELATSNRFAPPPNPSVGCAIGTPESSKLGQGHTQRAGGPHAEIMALRDAAGKGNSVVGATAYVTLEPCSHHGRTGPCCDALIAAGIKKVVATNLDPNPLVAGQGFARLRAAGVEVEVLDPTDPMAIASRELNIGFFSRMIRKTPWVRMKVAASLDGTTALNNGASQWITSPEARADGHTWRARSCAILTGIGTVLADKPRLDVRLVETSRQPHLVVVDSDLQTPLNAPFFIAGRTVFIYAAIRSDARQAALEALGAKVIYLPGYNAQGQPTGKVDLTAMLTDLGQREINELHVEAGFKLNGSLVREGLVDEFVVYLAPKLLGQGAGMFNIGPLPELAQGVALDFKSTDMVGPDLRIVARVQGRDNF